MADIHSDKYTAGAVDIPMENKRPSSDPTVRTTWQKWQRSQFINLSLAFFTTATSIRTHRGIGGVLLALQKFNEYLNLSTPGFIYWFNLTWRRIAETTGEVALRQHAEQNETRISASTRNERAYTVVKRRICEMSELLFSTSEFFVGCCVWRAKTLLSPIVSR